jgi:hypothetical protein
MNSRCARLYSPAILRAAAKSGDGGSQTGAALRPARAATFGVAGPHSSTFDTRTSHDRVPSARRRVAGSALLLPASPARPLAASAGSPLFCDYGLQRPNVHRLFGHDVLQEMAEAGNVFRVGRTQVMKTHGPIGKVPLYRVALEQGLAPSVPRIAYDLFIESEYSFLLSFEDL